MHPLLALLATRPQLLLDHAQAYAALFQEEFGQARAAGGGFGGPDCYRKPCPQS